MRDVTQEQPTDSDDKFNEGDYPVTDPLRSYTFCGLPVFPRLRQSATEAESLVVARRSFEESAFVSPAGYISLRDYGSNVSYEAVTEGTALSHTVCARVSHAPFSFEIKYGSDSPVLTKEAIMLEVGLGFTLAVPRKSESIVKAATSLRKRQADFRDYTLYEVLFSGYLRDIIAQNSVETLLENPDVIISEIKETANQIFGEIGLEVLEIQATNVSLSPRSRYNPEENVLHARGLETLKELGIELE